MSKNGVNSLSGGLDLDSERDPIQEEGSIDVGTEVDDISEIMNLRLEVLNTINQPNVSKLVVSPKELRDLDLMSGLIGDKPLTLLVRSNRSDKLWEHGWLSTGWIRRAPTTEGEALADALNGTRVTDVQFQAGDRFINADRKEIGRVMKANAQRLSEAQEEKAERCRQAAEDEVQERMNTEAMERNAQRRADDYEQGLLTRPFRESQDILEESERGLLKEIEELSKEVKVLSKKVIKNQKQVRATKAKAKETLTECVGELDGLKRKLDGYLSTLDEGNDQVDEVKFDFSAPKNVLIAGRQALQEKREEFVGNLRAMRKRPTPEISSSNDGQVEDEADGRLRSGTPFKFSRPT